MAIISRQAKFEVAELDASKNSCNNAMAIAGSKSANGEKGLDAGRHPGNGKGNAQRNEAVRSAIIDALFTLMESERFSSISVLQITSEARVARMSYYRNFESKEQIIEAYIDRPHDDLIAESHADAACAKDADGLLDEQKFASGFERSLERMRVEKQRVLTLINAGFATTLQRMMDGYLEERLGDMPAWSIERYELYFVSGALLNVLTKWLEQGAKEPPKEMAKFCAKLLRDGLDTKSNCVDV